MQTFTVDPRRWWIGRLFTRNPLLRRSDRIEVLVVLAALVVSLAGIAVAGAVGAEIHDAERRGDVTRSQALHPRSATVLDVEVGAATNFDGAETPMVRARWAIDNGWRTESFPWGAEVKPGDRIDIWVTDGGNRIDPPTPLRPVVDALTVAASITLLVLILSISLPALLHRRFQQARAAQWDREIGTLADGATPGKSP